MDRDDELFPQERIKTFFSGIRDIVKKGELAEVLACEIEQFNIHDLQRISASIDREIDRLPSPYREKIHPYFMEQFFSRYFKALKVHGDGLLNKINGDINDLETYRKYCDMMLVREVDEKGEGIFEPQYSGYYQLLSCFAMFVLDEPGHPVGMPFPGGFAVERREDGYYCPIRDKEKDLPFSICNFCPAKQSEMP